MKKARTAFKKYIDFFIDFSQKNDEKSSPEVRKTLFARNIDKIMLPGTPFLAKERFLADFWIPEGTPNLLKIHAPFVGNGPWTPSFHQFVRSHDFFCVFAQFWVHSGRLLGQFWINFRISLCFVGVRLPFCFLWFFLVFLVFVVGWVDWCCWSCCFF